MNKIKVIDLLNMISKGEEVPKKIEYEGEIYEFNKNIHGYWGGKNNDCFRAMVNWRCLNNEVEILEEEKKIPGKLNEDFNQHCNEYLYKKVEDKVNEIIDYLDYLKSKGKGE